MKKSSGVCKESSSGTHVYTAAPQNYSAMSSLRVSLLVSLHPTNNLLYYSAKIQKHCPHWATKLPASPDLPLLKTPLHPPSLPGTPPQTCPRLSLLRRRGLHRLRRRGDLAAFLAAAESVDLPVRHVRRVRCKRKKEGKKGGQLAKRRSATWRPVCMFQSTFLTCAYPCNQWTSDIETKFIHVWLKQY